MSDTDRVLDALRDAGPSGLHSHDMRVHGLTGDPSRRILDLRARGHAIEARPERRGKRPGRRYILLGEAGLVIASPGASPGDSSPSPKRPVRGATPAPVALFEFADRPSYMDPE